MGDKAKTAKTKAKTKVKDPCLICKKTCNDNSFSVDCIVCKQWTHRDCDSEIDDATWTFIDRQMKTKGGHFWACNACTFAHQGLDKLVTKLSLDVEELKEHTQWHDEEIEKIEETANKNKESIEE